MMLRRVAQEIADFIEADDVLHDAGHVTVVVEDKADVGFELQQALGRTGVCVLVAVTGFRRVDRGSLPQGDAEIQISCYEHPVLNREDPANMTSQSVMERLVNILHYERFESTVGQMVFESFSRDDIDEANVVRGNFKVHVDLRN